MNDSSPPNPPAASTPPIQLTYETPRPLPPSTLGPPGPLARTLWWLSYHLGRAVGHIAAKPHRRTRPD